MVPNDIRNPVSRRIRTGRRKRADWVIVAPFDPVFFFNYSEIKVFVKREGGAVGLYSRPRGSSNNCPYKILLRLFRLVLYHARRMVAV